MYFNSDKNDTNIDNEFKQQKNILSTSSKKINKYIFLIIIPIIVILLIAMIYFFANRELPTYLTLDGEEIITIYQGSDYIEPGYKAYNSKDEDLSSNVEIKSTLNTDKVGEYEIIYTLGDISKVRKINVIAKSASYTYIYLKTVNNSVNVYLKVGEKYTEPGYQVFNSEGLDLTSQVKVTGSVDTSKRGNYKLTYSVVDPNNVTVSASRTVIVMDTEISLSLNNENYTNGKVSINAMVTDNYFDYMILPNNTKITQSTYIYDVSENGTYKFIVYNKKGTKKEASIEVKNINKTVPTGSCSGSYKDEVSTINITATDDIGISKYMINGVSYTQNKITLTGELEKVNITIYDKAGNTKNISCNLEDKNEVIISDKSITFSYKYIKDGSPMPYALYTPSSVNDSKKPIPLIIWLHGSGEVGSSESAFKNSGLLKVLSNWSLDGFNAYVICPHLSGSGYSSSWQPSTIQNKLYSLIDKFVKENNINTDKIILTGHSLGGIGVLYTAYQRPNFYSALVVMSGYDPGVDISTLKHIPTRGYSEYISFMNNKFQSTFGSENYYQLNTSHGNVPNAALNMDENNDNKSDLVEWMLTQQK